jgi:DNA helicase IV
VPASSDTEQEPDQAADTDPVIAAERSYLLEARNFLGLMRDNVLALDSRVAADRVSEEYLKATLYWRAEELKDLPDTPLFFGKLDYLQPPGLDELDAGSIEDADCEEFYIGRRHVHDPEGRPIVIDWRAPVARPFYRASRAEPMGLLGRRRFGFSGGALTAYEDEDFTAPVPGRADGQADARADGQGVSQILLDEIERPRSGPMRDIVATIQPDQDDIVRASADDTICVQGAPGTGKTAVGLHRVAYLLYAYRDRITRRGVLVIGPNRAFLSYIRNVLPALGEMEVTQATMTDLVAGQAKLKVRAADAEQAAWVKGDARMAEVLRRALWSHLSEPPEALLLVRGSRRWRISTYELGDLAAELRDRGVRYGAGRDMLANRIAHVVLTKMEAAGEACDDRTHDAVRRTRQVKAVVDAIWPKVDPSRLVYGLLSDPQVLARAADGVLTEAEQEALSWPAAGGDSPAGRGLGSARWSAADLVLIDEAAALIDRPPGVAHVVVDEAQDLSPMECRAIARRCETGSATVLGDLAQGTSPRATASWPDLLAHLGESNAQLRVLEMGYRVPRQILDFANRLLDEIGPDLGRPASLRHDPAALDIQPVGPGELDAALLAACGEAARRPGSVAVIAADDQVTALHRALRAAGVEHAVLDGIQPEGQLSIVPVSLVKGLEFDQVIVVEPARISALDRRGMQRLYVALTRAVSRLTVLHTQPLPAALR